ncbi:MAG TPA: YncE family protein [Candidatus Angelobacter sp.]|nr:YncE family protein [Candidatus Angelobacter sp.]
MRKTSSLLGLTCLFAVAILTCAGLLSHAATPAPGASGYKVVKTVPIGGEGGWDYVYVDSDARRVYISHGTHTVVMDADTYAVVGDIPDTQGVHGIAIASSLGRGFISDGRTNDVTIFDLKTLKTIGKVPTDANPDAIAYEPVSKRVFTFNGRGKNATAINAADGTVLGNIDLRGKPEFAAADGKGSIYVNNEDSSELHHLDAASLKELHHWPLAPCKSPSGLAMDTKNRRLFSVCDEKVMAVVDADTGKVVATPTICDGPDAAAFDPATGYAFASCGDGNLTVIHEDTPDKFTVVENVPTKRSARTMGLDLKTHTIFLPAADFDPPAPGERRGKMKPNSFVIVVVSK